MARILNERGIRSRHGHEFHDTQIAKMLKCPSAKGVYRINASRRPGEKAWESETKPESEWGSSPCVPIVSEEVFDRVNRILEEQHKPARKPGKKPAHIFSGLLKCGCGSKMYVYTRSPNYSCMKCKNKIGAAAMEEVFIGAIGSSLADSGKIGAHLSVAKQKIADRQARAGVAREQINAVMSEMKKVYDLYIAGGVDVDRFKQINAPLAERLAQLNAELPRLEGEVAALQVSALSTDAIATEARSLASIWPTLDLEGKQRLASLLCSGIIVPHDDPEAPIDITFSHTPIATPSPTPQGVSDSSSNCLNTQPSLRL